MHRSLNLLHRCVSTWKMFIPAAQDEHHHDGEEAGVDLVNGHLGLGNRLPEGEVEGQDELMQHFEEQPEPGHLAA